jgi:hypothetical protein
MRCEVRMCKPDSCEANHSHAGIDVLQMPCVKKISPTAIRME